jgi:hypothetical protein
MSDLDDKVEALKTLLPLLEEHLDDIPGALKVARLGETRGGESSDSFKWMGRKAKTWSRYRLRAVSRSFEALADEDPRSAQALYWTYVNPWDRFDADDLDDLLERGLYWMADEIPGELPIYGETRKDTVCRLYRKGYKRDEISHGLHMSGRDVSKMIKEGREDAQHYQHIRELSRRGARDSGCHVCVAALQGAEQARDA